MRTDTRIADNFGNALLEMLLFTPLAILFLFVVIDAGLSFNERAAISDAIRAGLNASELYNGEGAALTLTPSLRVELNGDVIRNLTDGVAREIEANIRRAQGAEGNSEAAGVQITVAAVVLDIEPASGAVHGYAVDRESAVVLPRGGGSASFSDGNPHYDFVPQEVYLAANISTGTSSAASPYAIPLNPVYLSTEPTSAGLQFMEKSVLLYADVRAFTRGINHAMTKQLLGRFFAVQEQHLLLVRTQLM